MKAHNCNLLDVRIGRFKDRTIKPCRRCGQPYQCTCPRQYRSYEEKETDVALGAMMVADAARGIGDTTLLISADTDLVPALAAVRLVDHNRPICLAFPPGNTGFAKRWKDIGNVSPFFINEPALRNSQMPTMITNQTTTTTYTRPAKWAECTWTTGRRKTLLHVEADGPRGPEWTTIPHRSPMGVVGRFPLALAAGLGANAMVAVEVAPKMTWADAMGWWSSRA